QVRHADRRGRGDQAAQGVEMKTETGRKINFNAGPAGLPLSVLEQAQAEFVELLGLPASHGVIALQGGASLQFAMLPLNFLPAGRSADYLLTGHWAKKAYQEAGTIGQAHVAASTREGGYRRMPRAEEIKLSPAPA